jgi:hypothetical protein
MQFTVVQLNRKNEPFNPSSLRPPKFFNRNIAKLNLELGIGRPTWRTTNAPWMLPTRRIRQQPSERGDGPKMNLSRNTICRGRSRRLAYGEWTWGDSYQFRHTGKIL